MTKKADSQLLWYLIGIALAAVILIILFGLWGKILGLFVQ